MAVSKTEKALYLEFGMDSGKLLTLKIRYPKPSLTKTEIEPVMQMVIDSQLLISGTALPTSISDAYYKTLTTEDIDMTA